jgi:SNF2 family DNA or RNA helicase
MLETFAPPFIHEFVAMSTEQNIPYQYSVEAILYLCYVLPYVNVDTFSHFIEDYKIGQIFINSLCFTNSSRWAVIYDPIIHLASSQNDSNHRFVSQIISTIYKIASHKQTIESNDHIVARQRAAETAYKFSQSLSESALLSKYSLWLQSCLNGMSDYDEVVRQCWSMVMKNIIPLAPIVRNNIHSIDSYQEDSYIRYSNLNIINKILRRENIRSFIESTDPIDVFITTCMRKLTHLIPEKGRSIQTSSLSLRPYQIDGITWLTLLRGCNLGGCLTDEMGLGKTVQILASLAIRRFESIYEQFYDQFYDRSTNQFLTCNREILEDCLQKTAMSSLPFLVICPASVVSHWDNEVKKFFPSSVLVGHKFTTKNECQKWSKS